MRFSSLFCSDVDLYRWVISHIPEHERYEVVEVTPCARSAVTHRDQLWLAHFVMTKNCRCVPVFRRKHINTIQYFRPTFG
ncbi:hypothetical protein XFF7766_280026 [Xanthomonas citri pv. fuscans]|nr:hypothetical protein XFF7766_280026 [Xanthomonas citri pv. fuscans]